MKKLRTYMLGTGLLGMAALSAAPWDNWQCRYCGQTYFCPDKDSSRHAGSLRCPRCSSSESAWIIGDRIALELRSKRVKESAVFDCKKWLPLLGEERLVIELLRFSNLRVLKNLNVISWDYYTLLKILGNNPNLEHLDLGGMLRVGYASGGLVASELPEHYFARWVACSNIMPNRFIIEKDKDEQVVALHMTKRLFDTLKELKNLKHLELCGGEGSMSSDDLMCITELLKDSKIKDFCICGIGTACQKGFNGPMPDEAAKGFSEALSKAPLNSLDLRGYALSNEGAEQFKLGLEKSKTLERLQVQVQSKEGLKSLVDALKTNTTLESFVCDVNDQEMDDEIKEMFMELFECNKTLQKVSVCNTRIKRPVVVDDTAMKD